MSTSTLVAGKPTKRRNVRRVTKSVPPASSSLNLDDGIGDHLGNVSASLGATPAAAGALALRGIRKNSEGGHQNTSFPLTPLVPSSSLTIDHSTLEEAAEQDKLDRGPISLTALPPEAQKTQNDEPSPFQRNIESMRCLFEPF